MLIVTRPEQSGKRAREEGATARLPAVKVLLWHGYLLSGSGSNVLTANVARTWRRAEHDVLVLCQDRLAHSLDFVDATLDLRDGEPIPDMAPTGHPGAPGRCVVARPDIGRLLPVYVFDQYEGFDAKLFVDLSESELDLYVERNVAALIQAIDWHDPDAILVGHEVMGPSVAAEACRRTGRDFSVLLHGSGLEYAVKRQERYRQHAAAGLAAAKTVIGGSHYMLGAARAVAGEWPGSSAVVNPGCDVELFAPKDRGAPEVPLVAYVGKLITSKGVHDFLGALALTREREARCTIVGYGGFEKELHRLTAALREGNVAAARSLIDAANDPNLSAIDSFLEAITPEALRRFAQVPVDFTGRLEHDPLSRFLPTVDVLAVPSVVPEAFGMVAAEAAACGVLPVVPSHSGIAEAGAAIEETIGRPGLLTYDADDPIRGLAGAIDRVLDLGFDERREMGRAAAELARARWSWDVVGERLLGAMTGKG